MKTIYECTNCDKSLEFINGTFICFHCGVAYFLNAFADTYLCWKWCDCCGRSLTVARSYDNLHFTYCYHCGSAFFHKEIKIL